MSQNKKTTLKHHTTKMGEDYEWFEDNLPWNGINDLEEQLQKQPTFVACEVTFILVGIVSFVHAVTNGKRFVLSLSLTFLALHCAARPN